MGILSEDLEIAIKAGAFTNLKRLPPVYLAGDYNRRGSPDEGIMIFDDDVDSDEGSDSYGDIIYDRQSGTIRAWTNLREDRLKLKDDLLEAVKYVNSGLNLIVGGWIPINFQDKYGVEIRVRRCDG